MADTTYTNGVTLTDADWFNDVNRLHYTILGDPANAEAVRTSIAAAGTADANTFTAAQTITAASHSPLAINSTQAAVNAGVRLDTNKADSSVAWILSNSQAGVNKQASAVLRNAD